MGFFFIIWVAVYHFVDWREKCQSISNGLIFFKLHYCLKPHKFSNFRKYIVMAHMILLLLKNWEDRFTTDRFFFFFLLFFFFSTLLLCMCFCTMLLSHTSHTPRLTCLGCWSPQDHQTPALILALCDQTIAGLAGFNCPVFMGQWGYLFAFWQFSFSPCRRQFLPYYHALASTLGLKEDLQWLEMANPDTYSKPKNGSSFWVCFVF